MTRHGFAHRAVVMFAKFFGMLVLFRLLLAWIALCLWLMMKVAKAW